MRKQYHPTRRKPQKMDARQVSKPSAHPSKTTAPDYHRWPNSANHTMLRDVATACVVVLVVVAFVWAIGMSYQVGYQAGVRWVAS